MSISEKRQLVDASDRLSITQQCSLLGLARSSYYVRPLGESPENLHLMRLIDEIYVAKPYFGRPRITASLRARGYQVNPKRVGRLMRCMGIRAIYPAPRTSVAMKSHPKYPYLLRNQSVDTVNQVWCSDITYIPMRRGFLYLTAVMDWASRYVLSWQLSNGMDVSFCVEVLEAALQQGTPMIFNTDKGGQYTSSQFTGTLKTRDIQISMTERGARDNIMVERLWRSVKYECIYLQEFEDAFALEEALTAYFHAYNRENPHSSLGMQTPYEIWKRAP